MTNPSRTKPHSPPVEHSAQNPSGVSASGLNAPTPVIGRLLRSKYGHAVCMFFVLLWVGGMFLPSLWAKPFMDDYRHILSNEVLKNPDNYGKMLSFFFIKRGFNQLTYMLDYYLYGSDLWGFHLTSVLLHGIAVAGVYIMFLQVYRFLYRCENLKPVRYTALFAAWVFGILAINTQPVSYLTSRANIVAVIFFLAGLSGAVWVLRKSRFWERSLILNILIYFGVNMILYGCVFLGLGGKEIIVTLPLVFLILLLCPNTLQSKRWVTFGLFLLPLVLGGIAYTLVRIHVFGGLLGIPDLEARTPYVNLLTQFCVIHLYYIYKIFFPFELFMDPVFPEITTPLHPYFAYSLLIFLGIAFVSLYTLKKHPMIFFGVCWFYLTLAPTSSIIPLWDIVAERRVYLSSIGLALIVPYGVYQLYLQKRLTLSWVTAIVFCVGVYQSAFCLKRNIEMTSAITTWKKEVHYYPSNPRAFQALMFYYLEDGQDEKAKQLFTHYDLETIDPSSRVNDLIYYNNILKYMMNYGIQLEQCERNAEMMVEYFPDQVDFMNTLQTAYLMNGKTEKALEVIDQILKKDRRNLIALQHKALILSQEQKHDEALAALQLAAKFHPDSLVAFTQLANYLDFLGKDSTEVKEKIRLLESKPESRDKLFKLIP